MTAGGGDVGAMEFVQLTDDLSHVHYMGTLGSKVKQECIKQMRPLLRLHTPYNVKCVML